MGRGAAMTREAEELEIYYKSKTLTIAPAFMIYQGTVYSTNYIYSIKEEQEDAEKPWELLMAMGGTACVLFGINGYHTFDERNYKLFALFIFFSIAAVLFLKAYQRYQTNIPNYGIKITMSTKETFTIWFGEDEDDRDDALRQMKKAISFWYRNEKVKRENIWQVDTAPVYSNDNPETNE
jgi:hypothetical protein